MIVRRSSIKFSGLVLGLLVLLVLPLKLATSPASAQSAIDKEGVTHEFETLPDGRVVLNILGERVAFHPDDGKAIIFFLPEEQYAGVRGVYPMRSAYKITLAELLRGEGRADELLESFRSQKPNAWVPIDLGVDPFWGKHVQHRPFLGKFPRVDVPKAGFWLSIARQNFLHHGTGRPINERSGRPAKPSLKFPRPERKLSEYGFEVWVDEGGKVYHRGHPLKGARYILPGSERLTPAQFDFSLYCGPAGAYYRQCGAWLFDAKLRFSLRAVWSEKRFIENDWKRLDQINREIAAHIFIDRKVEDFQ